MSINPLEKMITGKRIEKQILRDAFLEYLPNDIIHRQKEQISDGVGYNWIDTLKDVVDKEVSNKLLQNAKHKFPIQTPKTKEEYYYRSIFSKHFPPIQQLYPQYHPLLAAQKLQSSGIRVFITKLILQEEQ